MTQGVDSWVKTLLALRLLSANPTGLKGLVIRARSGPIRDRLIEIIQNAAPALYKIYPIMSDEQLFGGLDLVQTLQQQKLVYAQGLLARSAWAQLCMAERCDGALAAKLGQALDDGRIAPLIVFDEGTDEETAPQALKDRVGFWVDLEDVSLADLEVVKFEPAPKEPLAVVSARLEDIATLVDLAARFGIHSARAAQFALTCARAHAALAGRSALSAEDIEIAAALIYPSRATLMPEAPEAPPEQTQEPEQENAQEQAESAQDTDLSELPQELLIEAVKALLPSDFLSRLATTGAQRSAAGTGAGQSRKSKARGRPAPSRPGRLDGQSRVDVIATLRSAAPWQKLRAARKPQRSRITIFPNDIHLKHYEQRAERLVIFIVDASGSAAMARLAEAKGAVELLLAEAYARRDYVALIAFRGASGDLMLPPTRSLVQTKRRLSALPGGGGTPLAGGLQAAGVLAQKALSQGKTPVLALLTDGRANISLDGSANRQKAAEDAALMAGWISGLGIKSVVMDVGRSPNAALADLAQTLRAEYYPMPRADAHGLSQTVHRVLDN